MKRNPMAEMLLMAAQNQSSNSPNQISIDCLAFINSMLPQIGQTSIEQGEDEESASFSLGTVECAESPAFTTESLLNEPKRKNLKRPAAIQELLMSKRARLSKNAPTASVSVKTKHPSDDRAEIASTSDTSLNSAISPPSSFNPLTIVSNIQKQLRELPDQIPGIKPLLLPMNNEAMTLPNKNFAADTRIFAQVASRLTLLAHVEKYDITVGEISRRIHGPEAFNFSALGALLRRAKLPAKNNQLVKDLSDFGIGIIRGRRRANVTTFSCLTEGEAVRFARDFDSVTQFSLPITSFATKASTDFLNTHVSTVDIQNVSTVIKERHLRLEHALEMVKEFMELLNMDRSSLMDQVVYILQCLMRKPNPVPILPEAMQEELSTYSMLTHGFGVPSVKVGVKAFQNFLNIQVAKLFID